MTQREIILALIPMYEEAIEKAKSCINFYVYTLFLREAGLNNGVCAAAYYRLKVYRKDMAYWTGDGYWYKRPWMCHSIPEAVECLQFRLNKLKEILTSLG